MCSKQGANGSGKRDPDAPSTLSDPRPLLLRKATQLVQHSLVSDVWGTQLPAPVDPASWLWLAGLLTANPSSEFLDLVDDVAADLFSTCGGKQDAQCHPDPKPCEQRRG
jgi:hypothetical protein